MIARSQPWQRQVAGIVAAKAAASTEVPSSPRSVEPHDSEDEQDVDLEDGASGDEDDEAGSRDEVSTSNNEREGEEFLEAMSGGEEAGEEAAKTGAEANPLWGLGDLPTGPLRKFLAAAASILSAKHQRVFKGVQAKVKAEDELQAMANRKELPPHVLLQRIAKKHLGTKQRGRR